MTGTGAVRRGDELVELLLGGAAGPDADAATSELVTELYTGYPAERLLPLLRSDEPTAAEAGAWLLAELGDRAAVLLDEVPRLLRHPQLKVRFFALDAVLVAAGPPDGDLIAQAVALVSDPEAAVRWKALRLLARLTDGQLAAAQQRAPDAELRHQVAWLRAAQPAAVMAQLGTGDELGRRFAAAAAARVEGDSGPLELAAANPDEEVASFARQELELPRRRRR